jgi:protein TonB
MNYAQQQRDPKRQMIGFGFVIFLHLLLGYVLISGSGKEIVAVLRQPLETKIIQQEKPPELPPPPPPPKMALPPPPFIPMPDIQVRQPTSSNAITSVTTKVPTERAEPRGTQVGPRIVSIEACRPPYPAASKRLEEVGTVRIQVLVDSSGKVLDSKIAQSSGFQRLDNAALTALSSCAFHPGTIDGKAEKMWQEVPYSFRLE